MLPRTACARADGGGENTHAAAERAGTAREHRRRQPQPATAAAAGLPGPVPERPPRLLQDLPGRGVSWDSGGTFAWYHVPGTN